MKIEEARKAEEVKALEQKQVAAKVNAVDEAADYDSEYADEYDEDEDKVEIENSKTPLKSEVI